MALPADDALLQDLSAGREEAFERLYDVFAARLLRAARCICRTREDAEDALQDVFVGLVRARAALGQVRNLQAYLFAAVHRAASRRAERRGDERPMDAAALERTAGAAEQPAEPSDRLNRALASLPAEQRTVIALKVDGGLTFEEIAEALNVSQNTAASRYRYALEKLRASL